MRETRSVRLPFTIPTLPSGGSVWTYCGEIEYTLTCTSDPTLPFTVSDMTISDDSSQGLFTLSTSNSNFAIDNSNPSSPWYEKLYTFALTASWKVYPAPELPIYTYPNALQFKIVDYCVALTYGSYKMYVPDEWQHSLKYRYNIGANKFAKHVGRDPTPIVLDKISYTPWQNRLPVNTGCGNLVHEVQVFKKITGSGDSLQLD